MPISTFSLLTGTCALAVAASAATVPVRLHGEAWTDYGRMVHATDLGPEPGANPVYVDGTALQGMGTQFVLDAELGPDWQAGIGLGVLQVAHSTGTVGGETSTPNFLNATMFRPYLAQAYVTYFRGDRAAPWLSLTAGNFAYNYNADVNNLGLYLLRGPVYPGLLSSGFQEFDTDSTKATHAGFRLHNTIGAFSHDILLLQERVVPPTFDWSLAYVAKYRLFDGLEVGGGVNFYRLIPYRATLENPGRISTGEGAFAQDGTPNFAVGAGGDTTYPYTHQGTKVMAMFSLDLKRWAKLPRASGRDLRFYGEAAILGVKNHGTYYDDITERIPVMLGFNLPTFGILDMLSVEGEWYGSPYRNDYYNIGNPGAIVAPWMFQNGLTPLSSPVPVQPGNYADSTADNWKWSVTLQKTVARHVRFTAQVANDHYRQAPLVNSAAGIGTTGGTAVLLTSPSDWYFMGRLGFFF
ncbi:MAG TPA: hypothetical protein VHO02_02520 [Fibrobacteria bacterium]|nr:hypothetical protein [Fibrobacteria bacterium]